MRKDPRMQLDARVAAGVLMGALLGPAAAHAGEGWRNTVTPYFMGSMIEGNLSLLDRTTAIEVPVDEVLDSLDMGGMVRYRGEGDRFSLNGEVTYMKLSQAGTIALGPRGGLSINVDAENELLVMHADVGWKFASSPNDDGFAEVYLGVRYTDLTVRARVDFPDPVGSRRTEGSDDFFDPVIGIRSDMPINDRWTLKVQTDVGGFGVGMDLTWIAFGAVEYRFSDGMGLWLGYQGLGQDFEDAGDREVLDMDVTYHGPVIGLALSW